jgi:glucokinase-like ROK family protein
MLFEFNPYAYVALGINVRSNQVRGVMTYLDATPVATVTREHRLGTGGDVVPLMAEILHELVAASPVPGDRILGAGLAMPGLVDAERGILMESFHWGWKNLPLRELLAERFAFPIYMEEDDNALALGESFFGAGRGISNVICVKAGRGLGAGIIINGTLLRGPDNTAGEIGHILVDPSGPQCYCGNYGCLERMASAGAIVERALKGLKEGAASTLRDTLQDNLERINVPLIAEAANAGDAFACQVMEQTGRYLGIAVATLVNLLNPDLVIIGGGVILAGAPLLDSVRQVVSRRTIAAPGMRVRVMPAQLGVDATAIGAAALVMIQEGILPNRAYHFD